jgi:phenylacetic acid degradation operon negative regulatory protein
MKWVDFHSPNISLPVVKRRLGLELAELLNSAGLFLTQGGWGLLKQNCYPDRRAYYNATQRLRKKGLLASGSVGGRTPELRLTNEGCEGMAACFRPENSWNRKWKGIWYMFVYDIPEKDRQYRDVLRQFLKRLRLGCLQQSVWVTPNDIRPEFDDLREAAGVDGFAYLFEVRTVLGLPRGKVVEDAWNFDRINEIQAHYCKVYSRNLDLLLENQVGLGNLVELLRNELEAYRSVFEIDPLLPSALCPSGYKGRQVYALHQQIVETIALRINDYTSESTAVDLDM